MKIAGRKDVIEAVLIADLSAAAVKLVDALAEKLAKKKRKAKK